MCTGAAWLSSARAVKCRVKYALAHIRGGTDKGWRWYEGGKLKNKANNAVMSYTLVPENEADLKAGKISVDSPIGRGLLGKKNGETAEITVPSGALMKFEIVEISR